ncbi:uncharacterized protein [Nicotiana sylvestris]|uniref:uncharacterized protein n=1 Tax=Nicotiana sylvestris TaxID=4096 RepID=UPI00388C7CE9
MGSIEETPNLNSGLNYGNQTNQMTGINYNPLMFLSPADVNGIQIISFQLTIYFSKLKDFCEEFEALFPAPRYDCPKLRDFVNYLKKLRLYQFLMRLNNSYSQARNQILMKTPLPTVNQAYALIVSDESQKSIAANSGILGANHVGNFEVTMYTKNGGGGQNQRFKKNFNVQCEYCKLKGHTKESCYKLVGYPQDFRQKKKGYNV